MKRSIAAHIKKKQLLVFISIVLCSPLLSQHSLFHPELEIDTSYTIHSAFKKCIKKHPHISIAKYKPRHSISEHRNIVYQRYDKRAMHLDLFDPEKNSKALKPCILLIHGGGWKSGDKSLLDQYAIALADSGYVTITIEYRFSDEALFPAAVIDIKTGVDWIYKNADKYKIDTTKISILGSSAGGQLATLVGVSLPKKIFGETDTLINYPAKINAIIDLDGVIAFIHPLSEEGGKPGKPGAAEKWFGIHFKNDSTKWIEASALTYVNSKTPPTLFIASSFPRFNAGREDMISIMDKHNIYHNKIVFGDAPHSFWLFNPWFEPTLNAILSFLKKVN